MINYQQFSDSIVKHALEDLLLFSNDALELMLFTCANESLGGYYLTQVKGKALGIFQMEPATYNDIWINFIFNRNDLRLRLIHGFGISSIPPEDRLVYDLRFATAMTRIFYERIAQPIPDSTDILAIANYYKTNYNTSLGKADVQTAIANYTAFKNSTP
jgi:hypothetical protein